MKQLKTPIMSSLISVICIAATTAIATTDTWQVNDNGTVTDRATGYLWQQQSDGVMYNQAQAVAYCQNLTLGGTDNWRLPDIKQLTSIVDYRTDFPAIDRVAFPNTSTFYWSRTVRINELIVNPLFWVVNFTNGTVDNHSETLNFNVRCVSVTLSAITLG